METNKYLVTRTVRVPMTDGTRANLQPGQVVEESDISKAAFADALERGWITKREVRDGVLVEGDAADEDADADADADADEPKGTATRTHEDDLDLEQLGTLDAPALVTACVERALPETAKDALADFLRGQDDPKEAALDYLSAPFSDRKELCENLLAYADEKRKAAADAEDTVTVDGEQVKRPKDMTGGNPHAKKGA